METRNNSARHAAPAVAASVAPPVSPGVENTVSAESGDLLNFIQPTEYVDLPTKGMFYPTGHPLHNKSSIEIKMMTAKEEDILTNRSLIKKGVALDKMIQSLLVDKRINVKDLFVGDKNAIVINARISAYGQEYKTNVACPECGTRQNYEFELEEFDGEGTTLQLPEGVEQNERGNFIITLPKSGIRVETRLLNGHDETQSKSKKAQNLTLLESFNKFVVSLNNVEERSKINQFLEVMPARDSKYLREKYAELVPNVDMKQYFECQNCDYSSDMEVPLSAEFFWPRS